MRRATLVLCGFAAIFVGGGSPAGPPRPGEGVGPSAPPGPPDGGGARRGGAGRHLARAGAGRRLGVPAPGVEQSVLTYRARMKTADVKGRAFLEMWVRIPGQGEFFSRGLAQTVTGTTDWAPYEIPFFLQKGQQPDLVRLNVVLDGGGGTVWMKDVELRAAPLQD